VICRLCSQNHPSVPEDAVAIGGHRGRKYQLYQFSDGSFHDLADEEKIYRAGKALRAIHAKRKNAKEQV
jgi:hypothetical protein